MSTNEPASTRRPLPREHCANCGAALHGPYCHRCGQSARERIVPLRTLLTDLLSETLHFDTRFLRTLRRLLFRPGTLTREYVAGRRAGYVPPLRLFVFSMFVLLLLLGFASTWALDDMQYTRQTVPPPADSDTSATAVDVQSDTLDAATGIGLPEAIRDTLRQTVDRLRGQSTTRAQLQYALLNGVLQTVERPDRFAQSFIGRLSGLAFLMLPAFALLLKLIYLRSGRLYVEHLIFGLHVHAALFVLLLLVALLNLTGVPELTSLAVWVGLVGPGVYLLLAMQRVYEQRWLLTLFKTVLLLSMYGFLLLLATVGYLLLTLMLL